MSPEEAIAAGPNVTQWDAVTIVGIGFMGGSLGLALQRLGLARRVLGVGRDQSELDEARRAGVITEVASSLGSAAEQSDVVVICTPVGSIADLVVEASRSCRPGTLLTDVGSTKAGIVAEVEARVSASTYFVGSHPFVGSDDSGFPSARAGLLHNQWVVMTPTPRTSLVAVSAIRGFWESLGARVLEASPEEHDMHAAEISHVPHVLASALASATPEPALALAASGWRDTTRVAAGGTDVWTDILLANGQPTSMALDRVLEKLSEWQAALRAGDRETIRQLWNSGKVRRDALGS